MAREVAEAFRDLNETEIALAQQQYRRGKVNDSIATLNGVSYDTLKVSYHIDPEEKFTECVLIRRMRKWRYLHVGSTKRMTYEPNSDHPDPQVGKNIAFTRALRHMGVYLPENGSV